MSGSNTDTASEAARELETEVLIVGAGPTGLTLAAALALRGVDALLIDRLPEGEHTSRAVVIQPRTLEVLESLSVSERLIERGLAASIFSVRDRDRVLTTISFEVLPSRYRFALLVSQAITDAVLTARLSELGRSVLRPRSLAALSQDRAGVRATLDDGTRVRALYAVGTDGERSSVREYSGIACAGESNHEDFVIADALLTGELPDHEGMLFFSPGGLLVLLPLPGGSYHLVASVSETRARPGVADVQALLDERASERHRLVVRDILWSSRYHVHHRVAARFAKGRVALAGDAAHVHSPTGGQGLNTGIQDAVTLADTLQRAVRRADASALDDYARTRRPIAQRVVKSSDRMARLASINPHLRPARNLCLQALGAVPAFRRQFALGLSELSLH